MSKRLANGEESIHADAARTQIDLESDGKDSNDSSAPLTPAGAGGPDVNNGTDATDKPPEHMPTAFHGDIDIAADRRPSRVLGQIVEGIVEQLVDLPDADVKLRLTIDAKAPKGLDSAKVRTLTENARTLGFGRIDIE